MWLALLPLIAAAAELELPGRVPEEGWLVLEPGPSGWRLRDGAQPADGGPPVLLVRGAPWRAGPVVTQAEPAPTLGAPAVYTDPDGTVVTLGVFGSAEPHPAAYPTPMFREMTVQISAGRGEPWQVLLGPVSHHESPPTVAWVGDLDGDGALDLLTRTPLAGGGSETILWTSSAAAPGRAVGRAASLLIEGC